MSLALPGYLRDIKLASPRGNPEDAEYVWHFADHSGVNQHINSAIAEIKGAEYRSPERNDESTKQHSLRVLFENAELSDVATRPIEIAVHFSDFDDYWNSNTTFGAQVGAFIRRLRQDERQRLRSLVQQRLPIQPDSQIAYTARVNAVRGRRI